MTQFNLCLNLKNRTKIEIESFKFNKKVDLK